MADKKTTKATKAPAESLEQQLAAKQNDLLDANRSHKSGELVNPRVLGTIRKDIARLKTAIRHQQLTKEEK